MADTIGTEANSVEEAAPLQNEVENVESPPEVMEEESKPAEEGASEELQKDNAGNGVAEENEEGKDSGDKAAAVVEMPPPEPLIPDSEFYQLLFSLSGLGIDPEAEKEEEKEEEEKPQKEEDGKASTVQDMDADEFLAATADFLKPDANKKEETAEQKPEKDGEPDLTGPEVETKIATLVNNMMRVRLAPEKMKVLSAKCTRPQNVRNLSTTKTNTKVWQSLLDGNAKCDDLRMQGMQRTLVKGMVPISYIMDTLYKAREEGTSAAEVDMSEMLSKATDVMTMLSQCYYKMNQKRRHLLLPYFQESEEANSFRKRVARDQTASEYLFSDEIEQAVAQGKLRRVQNPRRFQQRGGSGGGQRGGYNQNYNSNQSYNQFRGGRGRGRGRGRRGYYVPY